MISKLYLVQCRFFILKIRVSMKLHRIILLVFVFIAFQGYSQNNSKWTDHLSYNETTDLSLWGSKVIVASEYGVFIYDEDDNSLSKFSKINGLIGERITSIKALVDYDAFVVGYQTGSFSIVYSDGRIVHVNDIENSGVSGEKEINTIAYYGDIIYIGTTFGIVEYNLVKEEFGDTFYFGDNGSYIQVNDIAFLDNFIFAATNTGVYKADANSPYLVDYNQWERQAIGDKTTTKFNSIAELSGNIIANNVESDTEQYLYENSTWVLKHKYRNVNKVKSDGEYMTYSAGNNVYIFNNEIQLIETLSKSDLMSMSSVRNGDVTWISTKQEGLVKNLNTDNWSYIAPNGPNRNYSFGLKAAANKLYVVYGYYDPSFKPEGRKMGYDVYGDSWNFIPASTFSSVPDLVDIAIDPKDIDHIYISSWGKGLLEMKDNEKEELWVEKNTDNHIQKLYYALDPDYISIRLGGSVFDKDGNLWVANGWSVERPFVVRMSTGEWNSFALDKISSRADNGMAAITIDDNGNKWISTRSDGIWVFNEGDSFEATDDDKMLRFTKSENSGNLPDLKVNTVAIDKDNVAWIGTKLGLVVFSGIEDMFEVSYFKAEPIIINVDGEGKKLLGDQAVTKIVVDGGNNKWLATESGGVYYTSANGQKTIYHFTQDNSPLPSNHILDLDIDPETGEVYFVTNKGLVSFKGSATEGGDNFSKVFAYPNPVRPDYNGDIYIKGLTDKTNVKITDINGNLVFETTSQGGQAVWNGRSFSGYKASSGVYIVFAVSKDGTDTTVTKILIVN